MTISHLQSYSLSLPLLYAARLASPASPPLVFDGCAASVEIFDDSESVEGPFPDAAKGEIAAAETVAAARVDGVATMDAVGEVAGVAEVDRVGVAATDNDLAAVAAALGRTMMPLRRLGLATGLRNCSVLGRAAA